jgi:SAM-dependent methyltransferase
MGIAKGAYRLLLDEKKKGVLKGESVLQLGRQCILFDAKALYKYAAKHGVALDSIEPQLSFEAYYKKRGYIDDITLFKSLGFKQVHSLDYSDFEGADIIWDLNQPIPEKYWGRFDLIYDGGTAEHVFDFPQVLKNIHLLLKPGGIVIHASPSNNHVDHGFYMYSPQVYFEYYDVNRYRIVTSQIIEYSPNSKKSWSIYAYQPGVLDKLSYGNFGKKMLLIHLVAKKVAISTSGVVPQQGSYLRAWHGQQKKVPSHKEKIHPLKRLGISLKKKYARRAPFFVKRLIARRTISKIAEY